MIMIQILIETGIISLNFYYAYATKHVDALLNFDRIKVNFVIDVPTANSVFSNRFASSRKMQRTTGLPVGRSIARVSRRLNLINKPSLFS